MERKMKNYLKAFLGFYIRLVLPMTVNIILITILVLALFQKLSVTNLLNIMFFEGSVIMLSSGIMAIGGLSRKNIPLGLRKNSSATSSTIAVSWALFSLSLTIFIVLFSLHFIARFILK